MVLTCRVRRSFCDEWIICIQEQSFMNLICINKWAMLKPMLWHCEGAGEGPTSMVYYHGKTGKVRDTIWIWHNFSADMDSKAGRASCLQWFAIQQIVIYRYLTIHPITANQGVPDLSFTNNKGVAGGQDDPWLEMRGWQWIMSLLWNISIAEKMGSQQGSHYTEKHKLLPKTQATRMTTSLVGTCSERRFKLPWVTVE